ncbi:hypothetical protein B9Z55_007186 [Caenorhabditis nigoni]|nr:hypothetical protein B9Z55_007186 [Caenorhabditis nigoni]
MENTTAIEYMGPPPQKKAKPTVNINTDVGNSDGATLKPLEAPKKNTTAVNTTSTSSKISSSQTCRSIKAECINNTTDGETALTEEVSKQLQPLMDRINGLERQNLVLVHNIKRIAEACMKTSKKIDDISDSLEKVAAENQEHKVRLDGLEFNVLQLVQTQTTRFTQMCLEKILETLQDTADVYRKVQDCLQLQNERSESNETTLAEIQQMQVGSEHLLIRVVSLLKRIEWRLPSATNPILSNAAKVPTEDGKKPLDSLPFKPLVENTLTPIETAAIENEQMAKIVCADGAKSVAKVQKRKTCKLCDMYNHSTAACFRYRDVPRRIRRARNRSLCTACLQYKDRSSEQHIGCTATGLRCAKCIEIGLSVSVTNHHSAFCPVGNAVDSKRFNRKRGKGPKPPPMGRQEVDRFNSYSP